MKAIERALAACLLFAPLPAAAQELGSVTDGLVYARAHCAECHAIEKGEDFSPDANAPSFSDVATTPGMTHRALAVWLQSSHENMPMLMVEPPDRDNVIAYILSLK